MAIRPNWDARHVLSALQAISWEGPTWRVHDRKYPPADPGGSLRVPGRYHTGWPTLYLARTKAIALGERQRHLDAALLQRLATIRITRIDVVLEAVLDCRDPALLGVTLEDLIDDRDFEVPRALGAAAVALGVEGLLVPTATRIDVRAGNLVVFPANLRASSCLEPGPFEDPRLRMA